MAVCTKTMQHVEKTNQEYSSIIRFIGGMHSILVQLSKKRRKFCQCAVRFFTAFLMSSALIYCYTYKFAKKDHKISKYKGHQF